MRKSDEQLRREQLVFYEKDIQALDTELDGFLELSSAKCVMIIDRGGHLVTRRGESIESPLESVAALIAGSFAATKEMARLLGEDEFNTLFHQGARDSIMLSLVGDRALLATLFDDRTNLGLVRFYCQETIKRLEEVVEEINTRPLGDMPGLGGDFSSSAAAALDELF